MYPWRSSFKCYTKKISFMIPCFFHKNLQQIRIENYDQGRPQEWTLKAETKVWASILNIHGQLPTLVIWHSWRQRGFPWRYLQIVVRNTVKKTSESRTLIAPGLFYPKQCWAGSMCLAGRWHIVINSPVRVRGVGGALVLYWKDG